MADRFHKSTTEQNEALLPTPSQGVSDFAHLDAVQDSELRRPTRFSCLMIFSFLLNFFLLASFVVVLAYRQYQPSDPSLAPANRVVTYHNTVFKKGYGSDLSPFQGPPSPDIDAAWDGLYEHGIRLHIDKSSAEKLPNKTLRIPSMDGQYIVGLDVFHQLHCLNMFRKSFWPEYYNGSSVFSPNGTRDNEQTLHYAHCLEHLRQAVMCHADVSTLYYAWEEHSQRAKMSMEITHTCRDFDKIREWAFERYFEDFDASIKVTE